MKMVRVLPPCAPPNVPLGMPLSVFGRNYAATPGTPQDVPEGDATVLAANGWFIMARNGSGPTANRPTAPNVWPGLRYTDTTVNEEVIFDGLTWRHVVTGAAL